jgi:hypothetical protein
MDEQRKKLFATLIDSCVEGRLTFDDMSLIYSDIKTKNGITGWYAKNAFHDLATLRYRFTLELIVSTIIYMLSRPRPTTKKALSNFEKSKEMLELVISETQDLIKNEQKQQKKKKRRPPKDDSGDK